MGTIGTLTLKQLEGIALYGIGSFILLFLSIFVISIFQLSQMSQNQNTNSPHMTGFFKIFYYTIGVQIVMIFLFIALITVNPKAQNPAFGIYLFWTVDWSSLTPILSEIDSGVLSDATPNVRESAKWIAIMMGMGKIFYQTLLLLVMGIIFYVGIIYPYIKNKNDDAETNNWMPVNMIITTVIYGALFWILISFTEGSLQYLVKYADDNDKLPITVDYENIDMFSDLKEMVIQARDYALDTES